MDIFNPTKKIKKCSKEEEIQRILQKFQILITISI